MKKERGREEGPVASENALPGKPDDSISADASPDGNDKAIIRKVYWGLLPWMFITGLFTYFDRANFSFGAPSLRRDLGLSNAAYGLASGVSFLTLLQYHDGVQNIMKLDQEQQLDQFISLVWMQESSLLDMRRSLFLAIWCFQRWEPKHGCRF